MRLCFLSILGEPGTYDASVYDELPLGGDEGAWFRHDFRHLPVTIETRAISAGDAIPDPGEADLYVLGGSYNSVHDAYPWQRALLGWLPVLRAARKPLLAICGGHQLVCQHFGAPVVAVAEPPFAGTLPVEITPAGQSSPLFRGMRRHARFHFANYEHVPEIPAKARLLARCDALPAAALDFGERWFSTQFHPEARSHTMAVSWSGSRPDLAAAYHEDDCGVQLIENFVAAVKSA